MICISLLFLFCFFPFRLAFGVISQAPETSQLVSCLLSNNVCLIFFQLVLSSLASVSLRGLSGGTDIKSRGF